MKKKSVAGWLRNVSIARKLYFTVGIMALLIAFELGVLFFSINTLSAVRAYVGGEGLWSKAQKEAMYRLLKYGRSHDEADYQQFLEFMKVPEGDHTALVELSKEHPDMEIARQGFIGGRNHPEDVKGMINLFRRFSGNEYISKAIRVWVEADKLVTHFIPIGERMHTAILSGHFSQEELNDILREIDPLNDQLTVLEDDFSYTLGEGSRWLETLVLKLLFTVALTVELTGLSLAILVSRGIQKGLNEILQSAKSVGRGDFSRKARAFSGDEIGILANSFNEMSGELQKSIREIEQAQHKFSSLLQSAPDAIVIVGEDGHIQLVNDQCINIFGYAADELIGREVEVLLPDRYRRRHPGYRTGYFDRPRMRPMGAGLELMGRRKNGQEFPVEISLSPLETEEGRVVSASIRDISEKKRLEDEIRNANITLERKVQQRTAELESKNKELEQFAYVASHDLQEPLRTTSSFVDLLRKQYHGRLDNTADKYIDYVMQASDRMKVLIKDLLDYSRLGRTKELRLVNCAVLLEEVLADLDKVIHENQAVIEAGVLPACQGYPTELKLLFQNLVANAIKFKRADVRPHISINAVEKNGYWEFAFADNGIGIDELHQEKIFVIFQRLHTRSQYEGSGIGLAHCKKVVEFHGGQIWVQSTPGQGSTFYFTIPIV